MRSFLFVTAKFDEDSKAKGMLIPIDSIHHVVEDTAPIGGTEIIWKDGDRNTITHVQDRFDVVYRQLMAKSGMPALAWGG